ncbi:MAG TPA: NB-ARC domain-containing protein, partial [Acidimicrobiia bacterium]|nr:NB-ARC domain-containing protein [Acidimicrobiia bacterium]
GARPLEQGEGDSFVAAFRRPGDAVACALAIQRRLLADRQGNSDGPPPALHVRMGIHSQEAHLRDARNYEGALMNRAARLRGLACGGQVLVSGTARALAADALPPDASLVDLGSHRLRDVPEPERVWQLVHPELPSEFPALPSPGMPTTNVPVQLTSFVGRTTELRTVGKLLEENRLVSLVGPGGVGKTRLAVEIAAEVADAYPHGVWFVDLSTVRDPADVASTVALELHLRDETTRTAAERVATCFAADDVLLILDNCEHVVGAAATLVDYLLRSCFGLGVLVTSREPLNVGGEATYPVPRLALPRRIDEADTAMLAGYDAILLFADRAHRADPQFEINDRTIPIAASICDRVDGLPLAIELAAARLRVLSLDAIATSLADTFRLLDGGSRTRQPRQQSLRASLEWSHDLLDDRERALLRRLAVFAGTFTLDAVEAVCAGDPLTAADVPETFLGLVDKSLVAPAEAGRYRLLETIRQFARGRLDESADSADDLRHRHIEFLIALAERSEEGVGGRDAAAWLDRIDAELANIDDVLTWAPDLDRLGAVRLASALVQYSFARLNPLRGWRRLEATLPEDLGTLDEIVRAKAQFGAGLLVAVCGEMALTISAPAKLNDALAIYERLGDRHGDARTQGLLGVLGHLLGGPELGRPQWEAGLGQLRELGDDWWRGFMTAVWGSVHVFRGFPVDGLPYLVEARSLAVEHGYDLIVRWADTWIAAARGMLGEHRQAIELAQRCLDEIPVVHDPDTKSFLLGIVGNAHWELGDLDAAERFGVAAAEIGGRHNVSAKEAIGHALVG